MDKTTRIKCAYDKMVALQDELTDTHKVYQGKPGYTVMVRNLQSALKDAEVAWIKARFS